MDTAREDTIQTFQNNQCFKNKQHHGQKEREKTRDDKQQSQKGTQKTKGR